MRYDAACRLCKNIHSFKNKIEVFLVFYRADKHIISSPTSGGSSPALNAPLLTRNINEYSIDIIKIIIQ